MCIGFIVTCFPEKCSIKKLILFNRDEIIDRPSILLQQWDSGVVSGIDIPSGGTWLAILPPTSKETKEGSAMSSGKFAFLTNLVNVPSKRISGPAFRRGAVITKVMEQKHELQTPEDLDLAFMDIVYYRDEYNGFNLVAGSLLDDKFGYFCTTDESLTCIGEKA